MTFNSMTGITIVQIVLATTVKVSAICALAWLMTIATRRASASLRHKAWICALITMVTAPIWSLFSPLWRVPLLPDLHTIRFLISGAVPRHKGVGDYPMGPAPVAEGGDAIPAFVARGFGQFGDHWTHWVLLVLAAGYILTAIWVLVSRLEVRRIVRGADELGGSWTALRDSVSAGLGLRRRVHLLATPDVKAGITVGVFRPKIVLPEDSIAWPDHRRRLVVSHELMHVKRWDALVEELAAVATVMYWFNPLVWFALKRLRIERERECDNAVLRAGARPSDYATQLMEIAADVGNLTRPSWRLARISQASNLKDRLLHILDPCVRRESTGRRGAIIIGALVVASIFPLSALGLWDEGSLPFEVENVTLDANSQQFWNKIAGREHSAAYTVHRTLYASGIEAAVAWFHKNAALHPDQRRYYIRESEFNSLGYRLLEGGKIKHAVEVLRLNVFAFPDSWNVYDSLGEAYVALGEYKEAHKNYTRSLDLGSKNKEKAGQILQWLEQQLATSNPSG